MYDQTTDYFINHRKYTIFINNCILHIFHNENCEFIDIRDDPVEI